MFSSQYCFAWQDCEAQSSLGFPPVALPAFIGTIRPSDCLLLLCTPSLVVMHTTTDTLRSGSRRLSPVDAASLYDMADFQLRGAQLGSTFSMET